MTKQELAQWVKNAYEKSGTPSSESGLSRTEGTTGTISLMIDGKNFTLTKQALADELGSDDDLASRIWNWILP